tara:strand:+ start:2490 stop:2795 length:306 start_codon:yes stop_codon:yes gene_type:complete
MSNLIKLKNDIEKLPKEKHIEILNILYKKNNVNISENNNGTFINLSTIDDKTIQELKTYILYLQEQEKKFAKDEILKLNMEKSLNKDNKEQTSNNISNVAY